MNIEKLFAWGLLLSGVLVIFWGIYSSFNIFMGKAEPPLVFEVLIEDPIEDPIAEEETDPKDPMQVGEEMIGKEIEKQIQKIIPAGLIPKALNLVAWLIFMGILFFASSHLSGIGIRMLKKNKE